MDSIEFSNRSAYATELGIEFLGPNEFDRWPETHRRLFEDVQKLGNQKYNSFVVRISKEFIQKPWMRATKARAERLSTLAERSYREHKNEPGWRYAVENEILYRFTVEVACPICRNRLWQSEIPAATGNIEQQARSLEDRRRKRKPCQCSSARGDNRYDGGVNMLFSDRAEAMIKHDPPIVISTHPRKLKNSEFPDRIFGLRQTDSLRCLLDSFDKRHMESSNITLRNSIELSPFGAEPEPLLFPFFMLEAKSSQGADRAKNLMQSAFCLRRLLKIQHDLVIATDKETQWATGPLIWFLTTRGEQWDVYAGFVEGNDSEVVKYPFVHLWNGDIRWRDGALQLLLIIDYVFDWARDVYRDAIIKELSIISTGELNDRDPDVFSTISRQMSQITSLMDPDETQTELSVVSESESPAFLNISLPEGVIRDASIFESRFLLLQITEDDVDTFLLSFSSQEDAKAWLQSVIHHLANTWKVTSNTICAMERIWTGELRPTRGNHQGHGLFYTSITILIFITSNWEPTRQLTCLAISESALYTLLEKLSCERISSFDRCPEVGESSMQAFLERVLKQSIMDNLTAAISMLCLSSFSSEHGQAIPSYLQVKRSSEVTVGFRVDKSPHMTQLVQSIYLNHKSRQKQSMDTHVSFSRHQSKQHIKYRGDTIEMWPHLPRLVISGNDGVLVDGMLHLGDFPRRGLFVFRDLNNFESLSSLLTRVSRDGIYFKTFPFCPDQPFVDGFRHLNTPVRFTQDWLKRSKSKSILCWRDKLEALDRLRGCQLGGRPSSPMIISSDEE